MDADLEPVRSGACRSRVGEVTASPGQGLRPYRRRLFTRGSDGAVGVLAGAGDRLDGWYPYPFVDVTTHGYARVILNGALVLVVLAIVTTLFWLGDRRLPPRLHGTAPHRQLPDVAAADAS